MAYATKVDGLETRRDTVDHGCRHGGPYYTKKTVHRGLTGQPPGDEERVDERVRQSQWMRWIGSNDAQGQVLKKVRELAL